MNFVKSKHCFYFVRSLLNTGLILHSVRRRTLNPEIFLTPRTSELFSSCISRKFSQSSKMSFTKEELKKKLTPEQYNVTQEKGTEAPFTGEYDKHFQAGEYKCVVCETNLFKSDDKYDAGCGWPAFSAGDTSSIDEHKDESLGMMRTEVVCNKCQAHLGHKFNDGPKSTGVRYCINSASLKFKKKGSN